MRSSADGTGEELRMHAMDVKRYSAIPVSTAKELDQESSPPPSQFSSCSVNALVGAFFFATIYIIVFHLASTLTGGASSSAWKGTLVVEDDYSRLGFPPLGQAYLRHSTGLSSVAAILEPHRLYTLSLSPPPPGGCSGSSGHLAFWVVTALSEPVTADDDCKAVNISLPTLGVHRLVVYDSSSSGSDAPLLSVTLLAKYARREVRSLTAEDRNRFLDAAQVLWTTDTATGAARFGDDFVGVDTLTIIHVGLPLLLFSPYHFLGRFLFFKTSLYSLSSSLPPEGKPSGGPGLRPPPRRYGLSDAARRFQLRFRAKPAGRGLPRSAALLGFHHRRLRHRRRERRRQRRGRCGPRGRVSAAHGFVVRFVLFVVVLLVVVFVVVVE
jgi:hypothetical protein